MAACGNCGREFPADPNELEDVDECRYCDKLFCSSACLEEHLEAAHPTEGVPPAEEEERRT